MPPPYLLQNISLFEKLRDVYYLREFEPHGTDAPEIPTYTYKEAIKLEAAEKSLRLRISRQWRRLREWLTTIRPALRNPRLLPILQVLRRNTSEQTDHESISLMSLPNEIIIQIMAQCPASSIYCLRQTSSLFMKIFNILQFNQWHYKSKRMTHEAFNLKALNGVEKSTIANAIHSDSYCLSCQEANAFGLVAKRLSALQITRFCTGCNDHHSSALFLPEDLKNDNVNSSMTERLDCIGRKGHITLCNHHSSKRTTWQSIQEYLDGRQLSAMYISACTDRSHQPKHHFNQFYTNFGSTFPRFMATRELSGDGLNIGYGWDIPLVDFGYICLPTPLLFLHQKLQEAVEARLFDHRLCPHISATKDIHRFIESSICRCFLDRTFCRPGPASIMFQDRKCRRQTTLECRICGAVYCWISNYGRIILSMRYM